jgi:hypothetical protein
MKTRSKPAQRIRDQIQTFYENSLAYTKDLQGNWIRRPGEDARPLKVKKR